VEPFSSTDQLLSCKLAARSNTVKFPKIFRIAQAKDRLYNPRTSISAERFTDNSLSLSLSLSAPCRFPIKSVPYDAVNARRYRYRRRGIVKSRVCELSAFDSSSAASGGSPPLSARSWRDPARNFFNIRFSCNRALPLDETEFLRLARWCDNTRVLWYDLMHFCETRNF